MVDAIDDVRSTRPSPRAAGAVDAPAQLIHSRFGREVDLGNEGGISVKRRPPDRIG